MCAGAKTTFLPIFKTKLLRDENVGGGSWGGRFSGKKPKHSEFSFIKIYKSVFRVRQIVNFIKTREIESKIQRKESLFNV